MDLAVVVMLGVGVAISVHVLSKWTNDSIRTWRAASNVRFTSDPVNPIQGYLPLQPADTNIRLIQTRQIAKASTLYLLQLLITIRWLAWIARVLAAK
jgi:hypothetical protein